MTQHQEVSDATSSAIDEEVRTIIDHNYGRAKKILDENKDILHCMANALIKYETIDADQIKEIMDGKDPTPPAGWDDSPSDPDTTPKADDDAPKADESASIENKPKPEDGGEPQQTTGDS